MTFTSSNTNFTRRPKLGREKAQIEFQQEQLKPNFVSISFTSSAPSNIKSWDVGEEMWGTFRLLFIFVSF